MNQICHYVGASEEEIEELTERATRYIETGRFKDEKVDKTSGEQSVIILAGPAGGKTKTLK